uniref:Ras family GTPase n=1 Tax=Pithovirus LCPAC404 TaxID=2506597 RepID=A0A481ZCF6_9VIRU|nr:MAG: Ras family GTPase [Pithovirus LCPAC404]
MASHSVYNILLIGDKTVGKTTLVTRHFTGQFVQDYVPTEEKKITPLTFWTDKGDVTLRIHESCCEVPKEIEGCIIMFDLTNMDTYNNLNVLYEKVKDLDIPIVLCGNKVDEKDRVVKHRHIKFHRENKMSYYDISAKSNYNFEKPFLWLTKQFMGDDTCFIQKL